MARLSAILERKQRETGWTQKDIAQLTQSLSLGELRDIIGNIRIDPPQDRFDESDETVLEAQTLLLGNVAGEHYVWVDFDGAKRAAGHIYSKYAALIYADIRRSAARFNGAELKVIQDSYGEFRKNALLNHAISLLLQEPEKLPRTIELQLERSLDVLKEERKERLKGLIQDLGEAKRRNAEAGIGDVVYLSERVKFMPRLDNKTIQAAMRQQQESLRRPYEPEVEVEKGPYRILQNILNQVVEINQLARESGASERVIPQIMVAMAEGARDIQTLRKALDFIRDAKVEAGMGDVSGELSLVPLFETEATVAPENIREYLETMRKSYIRRHGKKRGMEIFGEHINEVFIAGSDLSKEIGQTAALVKAWQASIAVAEFNDQYGTDVRVKFGTGEAAFRQGGLWDSEAYLSLVRGKILDYQPLSSEEAEAKFGEHWEVEREREEQIVGAQRDFLEATFGKDWQQLLVRKPRGFIRLFRLIPEMNSYTNQSFSKERTIVGIDTNRLRRMRGEAERIHDANMRALKEGKISRVSDALEEAARYEKAFYQRIFGTEGQGKSLFGQLVQLCAKSLPAPELRDRALGREEAARDPLAFFEQLAKPSIDARAISANTASGFLFPLYLIGKGSLLEAAHKSDTLRVVMQNGQIDAKELLRQMKVFGEIATDIFALLRAHGVEEDAELLKGEWNKLLARRADIQEEMLRQESPKGFDLTTLSIEQRKQFAACLVPGTRELLDDDFRSDRTILFRKNFEEHRSLIETTLEYMQGGHRLAAAVKVAVAKGPTRSRQEALRDLKGKKSADQTLQAAYDAFVDATKKKDAISGVEYGTFLANVVTCYSPGM